MVQDIPTRSLIWQVESGRFNPGQEMDRIDELFDRAVECDDVARDWLFNTGEFAKEA